MYIAILSYGYAPNEEKFSTFYRTNILHHFKCILLGFHAFGGNHFIDVLHSEIQTEFHIIE